MVLFRRLSVAKSAWLPEIYGHTRTLLLFYSALSETFYLLISQSLAAERIKKKKKKSIPAIASAAERKLAP